MPFFIDEVAETKPKSTGQKFAEAFGMLGQEGARGLGELLQQQGENKELSKQFGMDFSKLSPEIKKAVITESMRGQKGQLAQAQKMAEKQVVLNQASKSIKRAQEILSDSGAFRGIGFGSQLLPEGREARGEYEALTARFIPLLAQGVSIRNQKEFQKYEKILSDVSQPVSKMKGALKGLEDLIEDEMSLRGFGEEELSVEKTPDSEEITEKILFNPSNKQHISKLKQLEKKFKGDRSKVNEALSREFRVK